MTTEFKSIEDAKGYIMSTFGFTSTEIEEMPDLKVYGLMESFLLEDDDGSEETKEIRDRIESQKGFRAKNAGGREIQFVIGSFRDGFDCWIVVPNSTNAIRI